MTAPVTNEVNFKAYCKAFEALGLDSAKKDTYANEICEHLHANWRGAGNDVYIYTNTRRNGQILSPEYGEVLGKRQINKWNYLSFDVPPKIGDDRQIDSEALSLFIAGVSGSRHIPFYEAIPLYPLPDSQNEPVKLTYREDLDPRLVSAIQTLYRRCSEDTNCLQSDEALNVSNLWNESQAWRKQEFDVGKLRTTLEYQVRVYISLRDSVLQGSCRNHFISFAAHQEKLVFSEASSLGELRNKMDTLKTLIKTAMIFLDRDADYNQNIPAPTQPPQHPNYQPITIPFESGELKVNADQKNKIVALLGTLAAENDTPQKRKIVFELIWTLMPTFAQAENASALTNVKNLLQTLLINTSSSVPLSKDSTETKEITEKTDSGTLIGILSKVLDFFSGIVGVGVSADPSLKLIKSIFEKILQ